MNGTYYEVPSPLLGPNIQVPLALMSERLCFTTLRIAQLVLIVITNLKENVLHQSRPINNMFLNFSLQSKMYKIFETRDCSLFDNKWQLNSFSSVVNGNTRTYLCNKEIQVTLPVGFI